MRRSASDPARAADARQGMAVAQRDLVNALTAGGTAPPGFDEEAVARAARSLRAKRRTAVAKTWPRLTAELGPSFAAAFADFAASHPIGDDGPVADGRRFAEHLLRRGALEDAGRCELLAHRVSRGLPVRAARLRDGALVVALRLRHRIRRIVVPAPFVAFPARLRGGHQT